MITDPIAAAQLVTREIRNGLRDGAPTKIAIARQTYPTDQADLWDAVTNAERIPRWFLPISGELTVGGRFQLEGQAGGAIERCEAPESFDVTWEYGPMTSWLSVTLVPAADGTTLELVHEAHVDPDMWEQFGPGAVGVGWDLGLMGLGAHIASGAAVDPAEGAAFATSPDGIRFVQRAAAGWADAAIGAGDEPVSAHEAAERTVAFYTIVPEDGPGGEAT